MTNWPHSPIHQLTEAGTYIVTCGTYRKLHHFRDPQRLQTLHDRLLDLAGEFGWQLEAWAVFSNHYHFIAQSPANAESLSEFISKLHTETSKLANRLDKTPGRQVWFNLWDSRLTFQPSYFARLKYVHTNAVHHRLVQSPTDYPWCSAAWFERTATRAFQNTLDSLKIDKLKICDEY